MILGGKNQLDPELSHMKYVIRSHNEMKSV